jgi:hypothetical protein
MLTTGAILLASVLASFTDWVFMDVLVHRYYLVAPALWRSRGGALRIVLSQLIGTLATAGTVALCLAAPAEPLLVVVAVWIAGPVPVIAQNLQWMNMHPAIAASHAIGWLARLVLAATAYAVLLT